MIIGSVVLEEVKQIFSLQDDITDAMVQLSIQISEVLFDVEFHDDMIDGGVKIE